VIKETAVIKVVHVITDLSPGGAELLLSRILAAMDAARFENEVISLTDLGSLGKGIRATGIRVRALGMRRSVPNPFPTIRLARWIRESKAQVIQTWMYHANLMGGLAARLAGGVPVVWGIHQADLDPRWNKRLTLWTAKCCGRLAARLARCVVFVSEASLQLHAQYGYAASRMEVIPNGFDLHQFRPDPSARLSLRRELGIPEDALVIGMASRFHPQKDHHNFIWAAARLKATTPDVHFVLCGRGITRNQKQLVECISEAGIQSQCHLLGDRRDTSRLFAAMDIATSSSASEAFPLAVGEAMACGTPCAVTDVGDSALIVGETGKVVAPRHPAALAEAWRELIAAGAETRRALGRAARRRIEQHFDLSAIVERYQAIYAQLADRTLDQCLPRVSPDSPGRTGRQTPVLR
jgi:glycosyltransferase involved in cell wall biosynthesis